MNKQQSNTYGDESLRANSAAANIDPDPLSYETEEEYWAEDARGHLISSYSYFLQKFPPSDNVLVEHSWSNFKKNIYPLIEKAGIDFIAALFRDKYLLRTKVVELRHTQRSYIQLASKDAARGERNITPQTKEQFFLAKKKEDEIDIILQITTPAL